MADKDSNNIASGIDTKQKEVISTAVQRSDSLQTVLDSIRIASNNNLTPDRVYQLEGMSQLCGELVKAGIEVPPMLYGFIVADLDRVKSHASKKAPSPLSGIRMAQRIMQILDSKHKVRLIEAGDAGDEVLSYLEKYSRLPEFSRFAVSCQMFIGDDDTPADTNITAEEKKREIASLRKEIFGKLVECDEGDQLLVLAFVKSAVKLKDHPQEDTRVKALLAEFKDMSSEAKAYLFDLQKAYPRTFHIVFGAPVPGEEAA